MFQTGVSTMAAVPSSTADPMSISPTATQGTIASTFETPLLCHQVTPLSDEYSIAPEKMFFLTTPANDPPSATDLKREYREKQRRILFMYHAIACKQKKCTVTPNCSSMKMLWNHAKTCYSQECKVDSQCVWTRDILLHYRHCRAGVECDFCGAAREEISFMPPTQVKEFENDLEVLKWEA